MIDKQRMYDALVRMVASPSISGTTDENEVTYVIEEILRENPYFQAHPAHVMRVPIEGDPLNRDLIAAYMELVPEA